MKKLLILVVSLIVIPVVSAEDNDLSAVKNALRKIMPAAKPDSIKRTPIDGLYEAAFGNQIIYLTKDGHYMLEGDLYDINKRINLTENVRQVGRKKILDGIDESQTIVFKPEGKDVKFIITAFTDIDCGYCRKLHSEIKQYNDLGIEMRYVSFPRSGLNTESYYKAVAVWCAKDRNKAMTFAKGGAKLAQLKSLDQVSDAKACTEAVNKDFTAARNIGVNGTPTLFTEDGQIIPGYVPPERLFKMLQDAPKG